MWLKSRRLIPANNCSRTFKLVFVGLVFLRCPYPVQSRKGCAVWIQLEFQKREAIACVSKLSPSSPGRVLWVGSNDIGPF